MLIRGKMEKSRKNKLINYLYPSVDVIDFMFDDLYVEMRKFLPKKICFSNDNIKSANRFNNYNFAVKQFNNFLINNPIYFKKLKEYFPHRDKDILVKDIITGYIMYLTPHINKYSGADVYADKRSICYTKISILDI